MLKSWGGPAVNPVCRCPTQSKCEGTSMEPSFPSTVQTSAAHVTDDSKCEGKAGLVKSLGERASQPLAGRASSAAFVEQE